MPDPPPKDGDSLQSLAAFDRDSRMSPSFVVDSQAMVARVRYESRTDLFLNDGSAGESDGFADRVVDEPLVPLGTSVTMTATRFGRVAKAYVRIAKNQVVSPCLQERMIAATSHDAHGIAADRAVG